MKIIKNDFRFNLKRGIIFLVAVCFFACKSYASSGTVFEIGTWADFCQGAVSHTFDDNTPGQTSIAAPMFEAKGFHITLFTATGTMNPNWYNLKEAFSKGHEIGSHSVTHAQTMHASECATSQQTIRQKVPGELCVTIAYPNCNTPGKEAVEKCYIAGRNCNGQINPKSPQDWTQIGAKMAGTAGVNTTDGFNQAANQAASQGGWLVWCHHGVGNDNHGYSNTATSALQGNVDFLDKNRDKIWCETFGNVARYIKERNAAKITVKSSEEKSITIQLTDKMTDSIFNYPLSIRTELPSGWKSAVVKQKDKEVWDSIVTVNSKKYIMFRAVPDAGDIVISEEATHVVRHSIFYENKAGGFTYKKAILSIDTYEFGSSACNVTLFDLQGKCMAEYNLSAGESKISVHVNNFKSPLLMIRITGEKKSYKGKLLLY